MTADYDAIFARVEVLAVAFRREIAENQRLGVEFNSARAEVKRLREDARENHQLRARMEELLIGVANGLKGDPAPLKRHDWSDLPALAAEMRAQFTNAP